MNSNIFKEKTILITGGTGTIGSALCKELLKYNPKQIRIYSRDDTKQFDLASELDEYENIRYLIGDVRDRERLFRATEGVDYIFHVAALKHVGICEYNPFESIKTNVIGTQNTIDAAIKNNIDKYLLISTDKATNPTNTMGATKLLAERLTVSANLYKGVAETKFSVVRFGNVFFSRGSVIPLFIKQIKKKKEITITDKEMTRFIMSIEEAAEFLLKLFRSN
ncbi:MAG: SDR family NAD(P)-dependent oxidoreductase [Candidatus Heimdallarchaeaceae archaeon]